MERGKTSEVKKKHVRFLGKISQKKIIEVLQSGHCLICPSITTDNGKREGLPIVIMEAAACGLPIIATYHTAIPEILGGGIGGGRGFLVKEKSIKELSEVIEKTLQNYQRIKETIAKKARQLIIQEYNIKKLVKYLIKIFNLAIYIRQCKLALKKFSSYIKKYLSNEILSVLIVGSLSRYEAITKESDIDLVIVCKNKNIIKSKALLKLNKAISLLKKNSGLQITPQIFTKFDLFQILSPVLMKNYIEDGEIIYGENLINFFQKELSCLSDFRYHIAVLKRCLFERYLFRQYVINFSQRQNYAFFSKIAKTVLFLARDFLYLSKNVTVTKRKEIAEIFYAQYKNITPLEAYKIINGERFSLNSSTRGLFIAQAIDFVEHTCDKIIKLLKKKYPNKKIYVSSF